MRKRRGLHFINKSPPFQSVGYTSFVYICLLCCNEETVEISFKYDVLHIAKGQTSLVLFNDEGAFVNDC